MKIACVVPPIHAPVNETGHGYMPPLGLLSVAGPLIDGGFEVDLIDADASHLRPSDVIQRLQRTRPHIVLVGHSCSITANPMILDLMAQIKAALPDVVTVCGGVYPTYACREILSSDPFVDFIVCGEGEITTRELVRALRDKTDLGMVPGLAWRHQGRVVVNSPRPPLSDLDRFRVAWELVDWSLYQNRHLRGRSVVVQFSRGCPHSCTFCGQWMFWKTWRHRRVDLFVRELEWLRDRHGIRTAWIADENWGVDRDQFRALLTMLADRRVGVNLFCAMRATDVVRDAEWIELYRKAGIVCLMLGLESFDDAVLNRVCKNNTFETARRAVDLLRRHNILSIANIIYGLRDETLGALWRTLRQLRAVQPDFYNAMHLAPLSWTLEGCLTEPARIIQPDQSKWDFRQPVLQPRHFSPRGLGLAVKLGEALFYIRPGWLVNAWNHRDSVCRRIVRDAIPRMIRIHLREWFELLKCSFAPAGYLLERPALLSRLLPGNRGRSSIASRSDLPMPNPSVDGIGQGHGPRRACMREIP